MKARILAAVAVLLAAASTVNAAVVDIVDNIPGRYVDVFYTPTAGAEFTNWDLIASPTIGSILDPNTAQRAVRTDAAGGAVPVDTFANTVFKAVNAGEASHVFTEYNPGSVFPPVAADPNPTAGAAPPAPDALNWSIFDTAAGDGAIPGFIPYHMARVVYSQGGQGTVSVKFFDTSNAGIGETFSALYGIPEPATVVMAGMGLIGVIVAARRRK